MSRSALAEQRPWTLPWWRAKGENRWVLIYLITVHALALIGIVLFPLPGWPLFLSALSVACMGGLGTTVGYHRALAHRAVKLHPIVAAIQTWQGLRRVCGKAAQCASHDFQCAAICLMATP